MSHPPLRDVLEAPVPEQTDTPDTQSTPAEGEGAETPSTEGDTPPAETPAEGDEGDGNDSDEGQTFDATYVRGLRAEAAEWRTKLRDAEAKYAEAKTPEQVAEITAEFQRANAELERKLLVTTVAQRHGLPDDLAALLKGDDEKALTDHAKTLAKYVGSTEDPDLSGGLDPTNTDTDESPAALAARHGRRRR